MPYCQECGAKISEGTKFCANCGADIAAQPKLPRAPAPEVRSRTRRIALVAALLFLVISVGAFGYYRVRETMSSLGSTTTVSSTEYQFTPADPVISNGQANVTYPSDYNVLANYSLHLINHDRHQFGMQPVRLSSVPSGQQHANSMLYFGYFSHWDTQGYKPYMRFTLLGGRGSVAENAAEFVRTCPAGYTCPAKFTSQNSVKGAIAKAENDMMYNDSYCCNNGHRATILDPGNSEVSIGVAWNATDLFFVEDFVDAHASFSVLSYNASSQVVTLAGSVRGINSTTSAITVFYDPTPTWLPPAGLDPFYHSSQNYPSIEPACTPFSENKGEHTFMNDGCTNYQGGYGAGYFLGVVLYKQPCPEWYTCTYPTSTSLNAIQSYATVWQVNGTSFNIQFSLSPFTPYYGNGVYTIYFYPNASNETVTSYSIFIGPS